MKKIKKIMAMFLATVMACSLAACGTDGGTSTASTGSSSSTSTANSDDLIVVGFSQVGAESDWRMANTTSMEETFTEENGYKLIFADAQNKQDNQITAVRNFIQQEVDYIVIAPITETGWEAVLKEAQAAEIPVIIVDRMIEVNDESLYTCWVGSNFEEEGDKAVAWMEEYYDSSETLNIVHLQGEIGSSAQIGRSKALDASIEKNDNWNLVAKQTGEFTQAKGQEVMESVLNSGEDIDVVYCENDNMAFGAIEAIKAAGKKIGKDGDIQVISFDAAKEALKLVLSGEIVLCVECNPLHGPRVAELIEKLEAGKEVDKKTFVDETMFDSATFTEDELKERAY